MSIFVKTNTPGLLVENIKKKISDKLIDTWIVDSDGDFTHNTDEWRYRAWIRPKIEEGRVVFYIVCRNDRNLSVTEYAIYHGRFVEMILTHFDKECDTIETTPLATKYDSVVASKKNE